ncbi:hypothetical protein ACNTMW_04070 [Planosporangium sp. 12N6]|uniref:hypothetical protein n=1 Tax=Planosporangium spinosum TaxID=3402278 RepID=UPI003CFB4205
MRWLVLYVRSRRIPAATGAVLVTAAALASLARAVHDPDARLAMTALAVAACATVVGPGLAGADPDLDRTAGVAWPSRRAGHLVAAAAAVAAAVLAAVALAGAGTVGGWVVTRDVAGLTGLTGLVAAAVGAGRAWMAPVAAAVPGVLFGATGGGWHREVLTWVAQPSGTTSATVTAAVLGVAGLLAYGVRGARR